MGFPNCLQESHGSQWSNLGITRITNPVSKKSTLNMPQVLPSDPFGV